MSYSSGFPACLPVQTFDVSQTWLAGMTQVQLAQLYASLIAARAQMAAGGKVVSAAYSQETGSRSVTYNMANQAQLIERHQPGAASARYAWHVAPPDVPGILLIPAVACTVGGLVLFAAFLAGLVYFVWMGTR